MKIKEEQINPVGMAAGFLFASSILLVLSHKYNPMILLDGKFSEGKYLVDGGRYGVYQVSPIYWWSSMIVQALTALSFTVLFIQRLYANNTRH